ncbi:MAG: hypothetical protein ACREFB_06045, partial [Stellaceae bacterium]
MSRRPSRTAALPPAPHAELEARIAALTAELRTARDEQAATLEVLGVINSSPVNLSPFFEAMLEKALRLCEGEQGVLWSYDGDRFHSAATLG